MIIGIDKGHSLSGAGTGAASLMSEVVENRKIGNELISLLRSMGHTVIDCSVDQASSVNSQLAGIVQKANAQKLDLFVSIHLNSGGGHGTETYIYSGSYAGKEANRQKAVIINNAIVGSCAFRNRGVKEANFYVLRETVAPAVLVEVCFVDSSEDKGKLNTSAVARAMATAITGQAIQAPAPSTPSGGSSASTGGFAIGTYQKNVVTSDALNVRAGRGTEHAIIGTLAEGTVIQVNYILPDDRDGKGNSDLWGSIDYKGQTGFIHLGYVKPTSATSTPKPAAPAKQYVNLPQSAGTWNVYPLHLAPVIGNQCGKLNPGGYGGLSYEILAKPQANVYTIQTSSFGKVNIYAGADTPAIISTTKMY